MYEYAPILASFGSTGSTVLTPLAKSTMDAAISLTAWEGNCFGNIAIITANMNISDDKMGQPTEKHEISYILPF